MPSCFNYYHKACDKPFKANDYKSIGYFNPSCWFPSSSNPPDFFAYIMLTFEILRYIYRTDFWSSFFVTHIKCPLENIRQNFFVGKNVFHLFGLFQFQEPLDFSWTDFLLSIQSVLKPLFSRQYFHFKTTSE